jgi:hypothetical protein
MPAVASGYIRFNYSASYVDIKLMSFNLDAANKYSFYPDIVNKHLDGSSESQFQTFIRIAHIVTYNLTLAQQKAYLAWTLDNARTLDYDFNGYNEASLIFIPNSEQGFIWFEEVDLMPYLDVEMREGTTGTAW